MSAARDTTGGLRWHLRAFWQRRRWQTTSAGIADWLATTRPASSHLLLIGGSAGWMMSGAWLARFSRITLIDIDPLAPLLFRLNHRRALQALPTRLEALRVDGLQALESLLGSYPEATIFFDNVLGQHLYRSPSLEQAEAELNALAQRLAGRDWGSVHDLYSGPVDPARCPAHPVRQFDALRGADGLAVAGLTGTPMHKRLLAEVGGVPEWMDHLTAGLFPEGTNTRLIAWPFLPTYAHWLQAGWISAPSPG